MVAERDDFTNSQDSLRVIFVGHCHKTTICSLVPQDPHLGCRSKATSGIIINSHLDERASYEAERPAIVALLLTEVYASRDGSDFGWHQALVRDLVFR